MLVSIWCIFKISRAAFSMLVQVRAAFKIIGGGHRCGVHGAFQARVVQEELRAVNRQTDKNQQHQQRNGKNDQDLAFVFLGK